MSETHTNLALRVTVVDGGAAGDHTVTGIKTNDVLKSVVHLEGDGTQLTGAADLTDEFSITDDDTINNDGGTSSANGVLLVVYIAADPSGADLNRD